MPLWSVKWLSHLNQVDVDLLLAAKCEALTLTVKKSVIPHLNAGFGSFAARSFGRCEAVGLYVLRNTFI